MKILSFLKLSESEEKLITRVFFISLGVFISAIVLTWIVQRATLKRPEIGNPNLTDDAVMLAESGGELLPIDIDAHRIAAEEFKHATPGKSIKHLLRILSVEKENEKVILDLGTAYLTSGMFLKAEQTFTSLLDEDAAESIIEPAMARYGLTLYLANKIEESITILDRALEKFPNSPETYCYRGQVAAAKNRGASEAEKFITKAISLDSSYTEAWYQLARYYMNKPNADSSDYQKARRFLLKLIAIEPLNPKAHSRIGMVYFYLHYSDLAEKSYQTALALNYSDYNTHYNLGELYYSQFDKPPKAADEFKKTLSIKNNHIEANFKLGLIALENAMYKEAVQYFTRSLKVVPRNIRILLQLGVAYEKLKMKDEAVQTYKSILEMDALNDIAIQKLKLLGSR